MLTTSKAARPASSEAAAAEFPSSPYPPSPSKPELLRSMSNLWPAPTNTAVGRQSSLSARQQAAEKRANRIASCWSIDPLHSQWLSYWDLTTTLALIYTAIVTPVEVAFLAPPVDRLSNGVFLANRGVDCVFIIDMLIQFRVMVRITDSEGTRWLRKPEEIASRYLHSKWFFLDAFSVSTSIFDLLPPSTGAKDLLVLRAVRVLRLAKLVRLARGSRIFKKWELRVSINYAYMSLVRKPASIAARRRKTRLQRPRR